MNITRGKFDEYPCVRIDGMLHITTSGANCLCGQSYQYIQKGKKTTPLLWRTIGEIDCRKCKELVLRRSTDKQPDSAARIMTIQDRMSALFLELRALAEDPDCDEAAFCDAVKVLDADLALAKSTFMLSGHTLALESAPADHQPYANGKKKRIYCVELGRPFDSIAAAHKETGINAGNISSALRGIIKTAGGYHWIYLHYDNRKESAE